MLKIEAASLDELVAESVEEIKGKGSNRLMESLQSLELPEIGGERKDGAVAEDDKDNNASFKDGFMSIDTMVNKSWVFQQEDHL